MLAVGATIEAVSRGCMKADRTDGCVTSKQVVRKLFDKAIGQSSSGESDFGMNQRDFEDWKRLGMLGLPKIKGDVTKTSKVCYCSSHLCNNQEADGVRDDRGNGNPMNIWNWNWNPTGIPWEWDERYANHDNMGGNEKQHAWEWEWE